MQSVSLSFLKKQKFSKRVLKKQKQNKSKTKQRNHNNPLYTGKASQYRFRENSCNHENFCKPKLPKKFVKTAYNCVTGIWRKL